MYRKCALLLFLANCIFWTAGTGCVLVKMNRCATAMNLDAGHVKEAFATCVNLFQVDAKKTESGQRVVNYDVLVKQPAWKLSEEDYNVLLKIVEAEAGVEDEDGKLLVANVVLNRVEDESFPGTVKEVVYQKNGGVSQFSPVGNGRIDTVHVSEETIHAVERAVDGEDISEGALYFISEKAVTPDKRGWFENHLNRLFVHGSHTFYL